jgi:thiol-disulfide isomerase/thioredoxin
MTLNAVVRKALIFFILIAIVLTGCRKSSPAKSSSSSSNESSTSAKSSQALDEVISHRSSWNPILADYYGKKMPDFKVEDINGKTHSLSDYRGRNIMVIIWATWCRPCVQEIPPLIALREIMSEDKLAMLAISNEPAEVVRTMAEKKNMTYTVVSHQAPLPSPFSNIRGVPSAFFIRPDGTLKIATEGSLYLGEMKSIILAE